MDKPKWEDVHDQFPTICEGLKKGEYKGCAAWNNGLGKCMKVHMDNGLCNKSIVDCQNIMRQIKGGL